MTKELRTYGSETLELEYDSQSHLIRVQGPDCFYSADKNVYRHTWHTGGKVKRQVVRFENPIALSLFEMPKAAGFDYKINVISRDGHTLNERSSFQSINSLISFYSVRPDLVQEMIAKLER